MTQSKADGSNQVRIIMQALKDYNRYNAEFVIIHSLLTKALYISPSLPKGKNIVSELTTYGYVLSVKSSHEYAKSIEAGFQKLSNLKSKIQSKAIQLEQLLGRAEDRAELFAGEMVGSLSASLGFHIPVNITLSEFNSFRKRIREKQQSK